MEAGAGYRVFSLPLLPYYFINILSLNWKFAILVHWLVIKLLVAACLRSPTLKFQAGASMLSFYGDAWDSNSAFHFCIVNTLTIKVTLLAMHFCFSRKIPIINLMYQLFILYFFKHPIFFLSLLSVNSILHIL